MKLLRDSSMVEWRERRVAIRDFAGLAELADFKPRHLHLRR